MVAAALSLLFCDTIKHATVDEHLDCISFQQPVCIKEFKIVANNAIPYPNKVDFTGYVFFKHNVMEVDHCLVFSIVCLYLFLFCFVCLSHCLTEKHVLVTSG
jgi:hypothetical protein